MSYAPSRDELSDLREFAVRVAAEAGELTLTYFGTDLRVETKPDESPVTRADREAELLIRERIAETYPNDAILGEEFDSRPGDGRRTWIVDPIDGTKSFVAGVPLYGVLIGLVAGDCDGSEIDSARSLVGVAHFPPLGETLSAARGCGAVWDAGRGRGERGSVRASAVSSCDSLDRARIMTSDFGDLHRREPELARRIDDRVPITRTWGDAYGYYLVATGRADGIVDPIVSIWDIAPLPVLLEESGGAFSDLSGRAVLGASAVASNGLLHSELVTG
ncbi:MAG: inositol monophosphatase family protein [Spirochaetota bacterium]